MEHQDAPRPASPRRPGPTVNVDTIPVSATTPATTRTWGVLTGNPFAPLADAPDEDASPACNIATELADEAQARVERARGGRAKATPERGTRQERRPWTLVDFIPTGGKLQRKKHKGMDSRMTLPGVDGVVSDRIREWSLRDLNTEVTEEVQWGTGRMRRQTFKGLRGRVSDHIPTVRRCRHRHLEHLRHRQLTVTPTPYPHPDTTHPASQQRISAPRLYVNEGQPSRARARSRAPPPRQTLLAASTVELPTKEWKEPERLQLTVELGGRTIAVQAEETDWEWATGRGLRAVSGSLAAEWTVATALKRALGPTEKTQPLPVEPVLNGKRVQALLHPFSWESLSKFVRIGGHYRVTTLLRGGMDPGHAEILTEVRFHLATGWEEVDAYCIMIQNEEDPGEDITSSYHWKLAQALAAKTCIGQMCSLAALPPQLQARAQMSPARIVGLQVVMERKEWDPIPQLPAWVSAKDWVEVRFSNVQPRELLPGENHSHSFRQMQTALFAVLERLVPALASFTEWEELRPETKVDGDLRAMSEYIGITTVIPNGPWVADLLKGRITITTGSYTTLSPREGFCEAVLDGPDSRLLIGIGAATMQTIPTFCALLNGAFRKALQTDLVLTRITTSKWAGGGKGQKGKITHHQPTDEQAEVAVGINVIPLILQNRKGPTLLLNLGRESEFPVTVRITCPQVPLRTLYEMLHTKSPPIRWIGLSTKFASCLICVGPLPKGWLAKAAPNAVDRTTLKRHLRQVCQNHVGASETRLIGRYSGKLGGPIVLYLEFRTPEASRAFCASARTGQLPDEVARATAPFNDGTGQLYTSTAPAEALELLKEKELLALLEQARNPEVAWPIPPPAHPPPRDAGPQEA